MLGIPETIAEKVAAMPVKHSWLAQALKLEGQERDKKEAEMEAWIEKAAREMWPEAERAGRIVREVAGLYLERKALEALRERYPVRMQAVAIPSTLDEAVDLGAAEVMYASPEERKGARAILEMMEQGALRP